MIEELEIIFDEIFKIVLNFQIVIPVFDGDVDEYEILEDQPIDSKIDNKAEPLEDIIKKAFENLEKFYLILKGTLPVALITDIIRMNTKDD